LNIPYICKRTAEEYDLTHFKVEDSRVKLFRTPDYGAITKVAPTLLRLSGNSDDYDIKGKLDTETVDALRLDSYDDRLTMYRRTFIKTKSFLDTFWQNAP